ncbi:tRNA pseudouridine(13) synthase TruD [Azomonas macrocytogenes]|uniref:tRNA pseudouridine synthase D n=1 Tax=Azomonas macrocytogenes TaxID=69962 RepID=A0A839T6Y9_AZOMA|nr:tRNA pseudouridine(13) synthase TruD [Azomonas macrocytogenes]MBB3104610.1 tRNA pseudouridine13 synthase [Azomonas macrocytogenes]
MTEAELLGPFAYGEPCGQAVLKATTEDFQVDEVLDIPLSGDGEHLWLWVEKRNLNTEEAARRIARAAKLPLRSVSYAGLKDRQALTRQWFSLHLPGQADPDLSAAEDDALIIRKAVRHRRKLQRGAHSANGFILRLTDLVAERPAMELRLETIKRQGVPNYFGPQRFGYQGGNLQEARAFAATGDLPGQRNLRSRVLSAARSYLFNSVLAGRVARGDWNRALPGDLLSFTDSRSFFPAQGGDCDDPRLALLDLHPTAPLWGEGALATTGEPLQLEQQICEQQKNLAVWLEKSGLAQERRILRLPIRDLTWHYPAPDILQLEFVLPTGCFATAVVRELVTLAGQTDI